MKSSKKATVSDVAKLAKVSVATVSRTFNEWTQSYMKPATREKVLAAAAQLEYRPSPIAQQLRSRKSRVVCLPLVASRDEVSNPTGAGSITLVLNDTISGTFAALRVTNYRVEPLICRNQKEAEETLLDRFEAGGFDAVLFTEESGLARVAEKLARQGCIVVSPYTPAEGVQNMFQVVGVKRDLLPSVEEVVRQRRTRVLFTFPIPPKVLNTYAKEIKSRRLLFEYLKRGNGSMADYAKDIAEAVISRSMDAVITGDEFFGWDIFKVLYQRKVKVPEQVTITGAADMRHIFKPLPVLQLIYAPRALNVRRMATKLVEALAEQTGMDYPAPPPLHPCESQLQVLNPNQFMAAAQSELKREQLLEVAEAELLGNGPDQG